MLDAERGRCGVVHRAITQKLSPNEWAPLGNRSGHLARRLCGAAISAVGERGTCV